MMAVTAIRVEGYRSLVNLRLNLGQVTVVTGPNGSGKSNLYRAFKLIHHAAEGTFSKAIAGEGGMPSVLWSGKPRGGKSRTEIRLTIESEPISYQLAAGLPPQSPLDLSLFLRDPDIKEEFIWAGATRKPTSTLVERKGGVVKAMDDEGRRIQPDFFLESGESVISQLRDPSRYPELANFQFRLSRWRFYHQFRTDAESPMRWPQVGCRTPILQHDGRDLAAALQTIIESGNEPWLQSVLDEAFPGCEFLVRAVDGWFSLAMQKSDLKRPLEAYELSDGTLRFLCLAAALISPDPPELIVLNEPEMSLNPTLVPPLARLIVEASRQSQVWVTTHSELLASQLKTSGDARLIPLGMTSKGETRIEGKENVVYEAEEDED